MTTIAVNKNQIAADRQATHNGGLKFRVSNKINKFDNPTFYNTTFYVGLVGNIDNFAPVLQYFLDPSTFKECPVLKKGEGIILTQDNQIYTFYAPNIWTLVDQPFYSIGSGMNFAMGAMSAGLSPYEAVKIASKLDPMTGMGVTKFDV